MVFYIYVDALMLNKRRQIILDMQITHYCRKAIHIIFHLIYILRIYDKEKKG